MFDKKAETYDTAEKEIVAQTIRRELLRFVQEPNAQLLDFGGGTGLITIPLAKHFRELLIVDQSQGMLAQADKKILARELENVHLIHGDEDSLPSELETIFSCQVMHHIHDLESTLQKMKNALIPQGQLIIVDYVKNESLADQHHHGFDVDALEKQVATLGFTDIASKIIYEDDHLFRNQYAQLFLLRAVKSSKE